MMLWMACKFLLSCLALVLAGVLISLPSLAAKVGAALVALVVVCAWLAGE